MNVIKFIKENRIKVFFATFTLLLGFAVSFAAGGTEIYATLNKPPFSPPGFLFPIVWTIIYILIGAAAGFVAESNDLDKGYAIKLYIVQLLINVLWPIFFFTLQAPKIALFWLVLLTVAALITMKNFNLIEKKAGILFFPYIIWLFYAFYLNFGIVILNS